MRKQENISIVPRMEPKQLEQKQTDPPVGGRCDRNHSISTIAGGGGEWGGGESSRRDTHSFFFVRMALLVANTWELP